MKIYELTFILSPNLDKDGINAEIDKLKGIIEADAGQFLEIQHLGMKKTSFEMKGFWQGNYFTIYYQAGPQVIKKLEAMIKLNEQILRYMVLVLKPSEYEPAGSKKEEAPAEKPERESKDMESDEDSNEEDGVEEESE
jgi:small subunit ribosomal protein S6